MHIKATNFTKRQIFQNLIQGFSENWLVAYSAMENIVEMVTDAIKKATGMDVKWDEPEIDESGLIIYMILDEQLTNNELSDKVDVDNVIAEYKELSEPQNYNYPYVELNVVGYITKEQANKLRKELDKFATRRSKKDGTKVHLGDS